MKNRLEWYVERKNMRGVPVIYRADFKAKITKSIEFYIAYTISLTAEAIQEQLFYEFQASDWRYGSCGGCI